MARNNRYDVAVGMEVRDELEQVMLQTGFLDSAPFEWIGITLRYGLKYDEEPVYQSIDKRYGDLSLAIELDTHDIQHASREELKEIFTIATLKVLVHVARKYGLPGERFAEMLRARLAARNDGS